MVKPSEDLIDRLGRTAVECRALIQEMHGARKDLIQAHKDLKGELSEAKRVIVMLDLGVQFILTTRVEGLLQDTIDKALREHIEELKSFATDTRITINEAWDKRITELAEIADKVCALAEREEEHVVERRTLTALREKP